MLRVRSTRSPSYGSGRRVSVRLRVNPVIVGVWAYGASFWPRGILFVAISKMGIGHMAGFWTTWKHFPDKQRGELMQAPISPGVYEVRRISNGEVVAFGHSGNVAHDLSAFRPRPSRLPWARPFEREEDAARASEFEYRTCAASTKSEAKEMARHLLGRRELFLRRRFVWA
jgi:hypothetical protein